jgi:hypothetical protein
MRRSHRQPRITFPSPGGGIRPLGSWKKDDQREAGRRVQRAGAGALQLIHDSTCRTISDGVQPRAKLRHTSSGLMCRKSSASCKSPTWRIAERK